MYKKQCRQQNVFCDKQKSCNKKIVFSKTLNIKSLQNIETNIPTN